MDFDTLEVGEDLSAVTQKSKQAALDEIVARHTASLRKELQYQGGKLISNPQVNRVAVNPVSQMEYNCRKFALLNIIRNPELSESRYPLSDSWHALYPHIPYRDKATNWNISKHDKIELVAALKEAGSWKHVELTKVRHFIERVDSYYKTIKILALEKRIKTLELQLEDNGNIWYRGVEIVKVARTFRVVVDGVTFETRHGTFDKLFEFLSKIDNRLTET